MTAALLMTACSGFLLAVLWMDLIFDAQVLGHRRRIELPEPVLASIASYYRRATTTSRPMSYLIALVMVVLLGALGFQVDMEARPRLVGDHVGDPRRISDSAGVAAHRPECSSARHPRRRCGGTDATGTVHLPGSRRVPRLRGRVPRPAAGRRLAVVETEFASAERAASTLKPSSVHISAARHAASHNRAPAPRGSSVERTAASSTSSRPCGTGAPIRRTRPVSTT